ncbi:hypothetical protein QTP88_024851 [Uroleucon formosanum]
MSSGGGSGGGNSQQHRLDTMTMLRRRNRGNRGRLVRWERVSEWTGTAHVTAWDVIVRDSLLHIAWPMSLGSEPVGPPLDQLYVTGHMFRSRAIGLVFNGDYDRMEKSRNSASLLYRINVLIINSRRGEGQL